MVAEKLTESSRLRLPDHVVYRAFPSETVLLSLQTATYHGLNQSGGYMLEVLTDSPDLGSAAKVIAEHYSQGIDVVRTDLAAFCDDLLERGLLELADTPARR